MDNQVTYRGLEYPWQCDHNGHINVMWYVSKFDEANWSLVACIGLLKSSYSREQGRGFVALQQNISYRREVLAGELLEIRSRLFEVREKIVRFVHEMLDSETGEIAATCEMTAIHMDRNSRKSTRFLWRSVKRRYSTWWRPNRRLDNHDPSMTIGESR